MFVAECLERRLQDWMTLTWRQHHHHHLIVFVSCVHCVTCCSVDVVNCGMHDGHAMMLWLYHESSLHRASTTSSRPGHQQTLMAVVLFHQPQPPLQPRALIVSSKCFTVGLNKVLPSLQLGVLRPIIILQLTAVPHYCYTYVWSSLLYRDLGPSRFCSDFYRAKLYAWRGIMPRQAVCPSVCNVDVSWSYRLEFCENNSTAD